MKISRLEWAALLLAAAFLAFAAGWFLRDSAQAGPMEVRTERTLAQETPLVLPASTPAQEELSKEEALAAAGGRININTAGVDELMLLPGIGEKRAEDIIAYRRANGPFRIPEELTEVPGIGEGILAGLIDYVTVGEETR